MKACCGKNGCISRMRCNHAGLSTKFNIPFFQLSSALNTAHCSLSRAFPPKAGCISRDPRVRLPPFAPPQWPEHANSRFCCSGTFRPAFDLGVREAAAAAFRRQRGGSLRPFRSSVFCARFLCAPFLPPQCPLPSAPIVYKELLLRILHRCPGSVQLIHTTRLLYEIEKCNKQAGFCNFVLLCFRGQSAGIAARSVVLFMHNMSVWFW